MAGGCSQVDISCYNNDNVAVMLETGIKSRHDLEVRFRKLCRTIAELGAEKKGRHEMPRKTARHRRSPSTSKIHFRGTCWTSSGESCSDTRSTSTPEYLSRGQSAFREALDEARETLGVRGSQSGVAASVQEAFPARKTRFSLQDESPKVSVSYKQADQTPSPPKLAANRGRSSSTREPGRNGKGTKYSVRSNPPRPPSRPEETGRKQPIVRTTNHRVRCPSRRTKPSSRARGSSDEGTRRQKATPSRVKTVHVQANQGGSNAKKSVQVHLKLNNGSSPESSSAEYNASHRGINPGGFRTAYTAPCRSAPLHPALRTTKSHRKRAGGYDQLEEGWRRANSDQDNERTCYRWQEELHQPALGIMRAGGETCFDGGHEETEPEGKERHVTYERVSKGYGSWNQQDFESSSAEETEGEADDQQRWRHRGRVLWSTHAEPAARASSIGSTRAASHTVQSHSQPAIRPYYGLYARSLRANGIDPINFRASRCGYDAAGSSCAAAQEHIDGSLLWRGNRGDDSFAAKRTRAPTDGLPDRLEAGRVLDSLNRRAELLGTMPPTPLRAKAAWMETPGDPEYSLRESSEGLLSSFCDTSSRVSTSLRAARADRRFTNYYVPEHPTWSLQRQRQRPC